MSAPATQQPRRLPFLSADADGLVAFCVAHGSPYDAAMVRRLLLDMTSDRVGVLVIGDDDGPMLVATVVDRALNGADAAYLEILGVRGLIPTALFSHLVVDPAVAFARAGTRSSLHAAVAPLLVRVEGADSALRGSGFAPAYDTFVMRRGHGAPEPQPPGPLPAGWRWAPLQGELVALAHAALLEMFRGSASFGMSPLSDFQRIVESGATIWRVLLDDTRIAGLVQAVVSGARQGELRTVARAPAYRGFGLGARLVAEGLQVMRDSGARDIELSVEARNQQALALYRRFGFEVVTRTPVFALGLR